MIRYYDASALVKRYVDETGSEEVVEMLREGVAATARYTHVEILSALSRRYRDGDFSEPDYRDLVANLRADLEQIVTVTMSPEVVTEAERLLMRHALRAGDALQLASCLVLAARAEVDVTFIGYDARCNEVAVAEGLPVID